MKNTSPQSGRISTAAMSIAVLIIISTALTAVAQSGRRVKKTTSIPVPTPEASPTPTPRKSPEKPSLPVFLGVNAYDSFSNIPLYFNDSIGRSCAQRLGQRSTINVELSSRDLTRGEAVKRAKDEKTGFVVILELRSDRMSRDGRREDLSQLYIEYAVFAAVTGKQLTTGRTYQQASGLRDVIVGGSNSTSAAEYRLKQAARVVAERILAAIFEHEP